MRRRSGPLQYRLLNQRNVRNGPRNPARNTRPDLHVIIQLRQPGVGHFRPRFEDRPRQGPSRGTQRTCFGKSPHSHTMAASCGTGTPPDGQWRASPFASSAAKSYSPHLIRGHVSVSHPSLRHRCLPESPFRSTSTGSPTLSGGVGPITHGGDGLPETTDSVVDP